ncbi:MAG: hypothetical protein HYW88_00830 [Candidatus Sungbacteria bacterium]|nr:hypothetical protein [Candidatus Sungbacteria bacterium]
MRKEKPETGEPYVELSFELRLWEVSTNSVVLVGNVSVNAYRKSHLDKK